jgi:hypothetical protein
VIHFIDRALATFDKDKQEAYKTGLAEVESQREKMFPQSKSIASLGNTELIDLLKASEKTSFFELLRFTRWWGCSRCRRGAVTAMKQGGS